ncbi:MAG TPA: circadian clock protein KaiC [Candidatus Krumholzibacteria bacterium]|nr:circadian clock protein KaiC [Candidatus Krumholzibacteria bacterium]
MKNKSKKPTTAVPGIEKCPTGIRGLDDVTEGGLPRNRSTLVCGSAGSGKTLLCCEFIARGAREFGEPGVMMVFEESERELEDNSSSLGFNMEDLVRHKKILIDHVHVERSEIEETGEYDLDGLFVRLGSMIDEIGAKRVVLDSLEALFAGLPNEGILRAELRRLFRWLKERKVTAIITGEQGEKTLTRHGLEEYVSDCVIFLDHRLENQVATRRLRVVKYRGSRHGTNEYPTLIDETGLSVLPISSANLSYPVSSKRISSGVHGLDEMLGGKGYFVGSSVLISGPPGSGKTSLAAAFTESICGNGGRVVFWSSEESADQIVRNMRSIGIDLDKYRRKGVLAIHAIRPTLYGLESHLVALHRLVTDFNPTALVMDPITNLDSVGSQAQIKAMLTRVIDFIKNENVTALFTSLGIADEFNRGDEGVSSLMDTWLGLRMIEADGTRKREFFVLKSRGMSHSHDVREMTLGDRGIGLRSVYAGARATGERLTRAASTARGRRASTARGNRA